MARRVIVKKTSSGKSAAPRSAKQRRVTAGSVANKSRRDAEGRGEAVAVIRANRAGEVTLEGLAQADVEEVLGMVRNVGGSGTRDMSEQVTHLGVAKNRVIIKTSGEELAVAIGKRVHHSRKGGTLRITWGDQDVPVRVHWTAKKK